MESTYKAPEAEIQVNLGNRPKSVWLAAIFSVLGGPFTAMLYLARPIRALFYFIIVVVTVFMGGDFSLEGGVNDWITGLVMLAGLFDSIIVCRKLPNDKIMPLYSRWYVIISAYLIIFFVIAFFKAQYFENFEMKGQSMLPNIRAGDMVYVDKEGASSISIGGEEIADNDDKSPDALIRRGNVVLYKRENQDASFIGRIIGLPGEEIKFKGHHFSIENCEDNQCIEVTTRFEKLEEKMKITAPPPGIPAKTGEVYIEEVDGVKYRVLHSEGDVPLHFNFMKAVSVSIPQNQVFIMGDNRDNSLDSRFTRTIRIKEILGVVLMPENDVKGQ